ERTRAIVVVHLFGHPADMDALLALARPHDIRVIEDAAQAPGVYYRGRAVGTIGDIGGFSLNYHKHIHTGEGGMLVTNDDTLAWRARLIRNHGENAIEDPDGFEAVNSFGGNYRLTELQAAIGIEQLKRLDGYLNSRTALAAHLRRRLEGLPGLTPAAMPEPGSTHAYYSFPIHYNSARAGLSRAAFVRAVRAELPASQGVEGIPLFEGYVRPLYLSRLYQNHLGMGRHGFPFSWRSNVRYEYAPGLCPVAERLYERELLLTPLVREPLIECDLDALADACEKVLTHAAQIRDSDNTDQHAAVLTPLAAINDATQV
ncbi:MAG: DegT/DnrJ/EryC1/StrS family aminotransferase, partial [Pseudomonadota bacterium]